MAENKPSGPVAIAGPAANVARPGVLSLNIREKAALYAAYMPFLRGGLSIIRLDAIAPR